MRSRGYAHRRSTRRRVDVPSKSGPPATGPPTPGRSHSPFLIEIPFICTSRAAIVTSPLAICLDRLAHPPSRSRRRCASRRTRPSPRGLQGSTLPARLRPCGRLSRHRAPPRVRFEFVREDDPLRSIELPRAQRSAVDGFIVWAAFDFEIGPTFAARLSTTCGGPRRDDRTTPDFAGAASGTSREQRGLSRCLLCSCLFSDLDPSIVPTFFPTESAAPGSSVWHVPPLWRSFHRPRVS